MCVPTESPVDDANQADDAAELTRKFNKVRLRSLMCNVYLSKIAVIGSSPPPTTLSAG